MPPSKEINEKFGGKKRDIAAHQAGKGCKTISKAVRLHCEADNMQMEKIQRREEQNHSKVMTNNNTGSRKQPRDSL